MPLNYNDPIKIIYSWIGPKGPIVNTELPNIMSFANVSDGAQSSSRYFWADDIYWRVFMHHGNFPLSSTFGLSQDDTFIMPFTLAWRIDFQNYFLCNGGILEFGHVPNEIVHLVRTANGFFLLDYAPEAWVRDEHLSAIHSYFEHYNQIPAGKIIYITGCMNAKQIYDDWCNRNGIPDDPMRRIIILSFPISQHSLASHISSEDEPIYNTEHLPEKLFLCWNRRFRSHRTNLALALDKEGLVDRSYYSMNSVDPETTTMNFERTIDSNFNSMFQISDLDVERFKNKLPLVIDGETEIGQMCGDFNRAAKNFYENSLVSIVTETNYDWVELTATEKTWKPAKEKHPFIIVGVSGALKALREFGLQTFDEFWDESYDEERDPRIRMYKIIKICREIGNWTPNQIIEFKRKVKPIVEHNFSAIKKNTAQGLAYSIRAQIAKKFIK